MKREIKATNPHKHDEYHELIYLTNGAGFHTIDLTTYQIKTPSLFLIKASEVHHWEFTGIPDGFVVIFKSNFLAHLASKTIYSSLNKTSKRYFPLKKTKAFPFLQLFKLMESEYESDSYSSTRIIASSLEIILTHMTRLSKRNQLSNKSSQQKLAIQFQELLEKNISKYHLVKEYAQLLHVSPKHLNEVSKNVTGHTASKIIVEALVLESQRQLLYSSRNISEIGDKLGFSSSSHFIKYFKKNVGTTPDQYRTSKVTDISSSP